MARRDSPKRSNMASPLSLPMLLTWARIAMVPLVVGVFYLPDAWVAPSVKNVTACSLFTLAAITDAFDGYFARRSHAQPRSLHVQHLQQRIVILIEQDGRAGDGPQLHRSSDVIDVGVSDHDLLHFQLVLAKDGENVVNVIARINHHSFVRGFIAEDGAVALQ